MFKGYFKFYVVFFIGVMMIVFVVFMVKSVIDSYLYFVMMVNFLEEFYKDDFVSCVKMKLFGVVLDLENGVFIVYWYNLVK